MNRELVEASIGGINKVVDFVKTLVPVETPVKHYFSDGVYAREISIPKGTVIVGKIHKTKNINIISKGKCTMLTQGRRLEITAPYTFESLAGEQKVVRTYEDTVWTSIHVTNETDLAKIEEECIAKDYDEELINTLMDNLGELQ